MSDKIMKGNYGTMRTDNLTTDGYYIAEWSSNIYTTQDGYIPPEYEYASEFVCEARF